MSGGAFDYTEHRILDIIDRIEEEIRDNEVNPGYLYGWTGRRWNDKTLEKFKEGIEILKKAYIYAHRIDYLLEADDGEDTFLLRLKEDLENPEYFENE